MCIGAWTAHLRFIAVTGLDSQVSCGDPGNKNNGKIAMLPDLLSIRDFYYLSG